MELTATNGDATPQTGTCSFTVTVNEIKPIGVVQGSVATGGLTHRSPFAPAVGNGAGQTVFVKGIVYEKTLARTNTGANQFGFFIQNTAAQGTETDHLPDGIWIFMGAFSDVLNIDSSQPAYVPQVGDEIVLREQRLGVLLLHPALEPATRRAHRHRARRRSADPAGRASPLAVLDDANTYWERLESMRLRVPANSLITDGLDVFPATADTEMWVVRGDSAIAARSGYAQRVFRDAHPLDDLPGLVDNGNGFDPRRRARPQVARVGQHAAAAAEPHVRPRHQRARRRAQLQLQQVPDRDDGDAVARERDRPGPECSADSARAGRRVRGRGLQRGEPLRLPRRPVRRLRLRRQHRLPGRQPLRSTTSRPRTPSTRSASG